MSKRKNTHRPVAPGSAHLPVRVASDREETTGTGAPELMAVGVKTGTGEPPISGQWELLTTTNATRRGTRKNENRTRATHFAQSHRTIKWAHDGHTGGGFVTHRHPPQPRSFSQRRRKGVGGSDRCLPAFTTCERTDAGGYAICGEDALGCPTAEYAAHWSKRWSIKSRRVNELAISRPLPSRAFASCLRGLGMGLGQIGCVLQPQGKVPRSRKTASAPVAHYVLPYSQHRSELADAALGINCSFEYVHSCILNTFVFQ